MKAMGVSQICAALRVSSSITGSTPVSRILHCQIDSSLAALVWGSRALMIIVPTFDAPSFAATSDRRAAVLIYTPLLDKILILLRFPFSAYRNNTELAFKKQTDKLF
jgi:hypothetical protein